MIERRHAIAVVDDDPRVLESLQELLESAGYAVRTFASGRALLDTGLDGIDCLITDIGMPIMDGFTTTAKLRDQERNNRHTPVVAITATATTEDHDRCIAAGMDDYLPKPITMERLAEILHQWAPLPPGLRR